MNCVRRGAGANRPAASTPFRSRSPGETPPRDRARPEPRGGRARLFLLLPVLALLLGALGPFAAAPAEAQSTTTVWSATLTVKDTSDYHGCDNDLGATAACSNTAVLTDDDFDYVSGGTSTTYTFDYIQSDSSWLGIQFTSGDQSTIKAALSGLTFTATKTGGTARSFAIADSTLFASGEAGMAWSGTNNLGWATGDTVELKLTAPVTNSAATGKPTISGTASVGQTLTAAKGTIADTNGVTKANNGDAGFAYTYQWIRVDSDGTSNAANISAATSTTYTLASADQGKRVKVKVDFKDDAGNAESRTSDAYPTSGTIAAAPTTPAIAGLSATPDETSVRLNWTNPGSCSAIAGCSYRLRHRTTGGTWGNWTTLGVTSSRTVSSLSAATSYEFMLERRRGGGTLARSTISAMTLSPDTTAPTAPSALALVSGTTSPGNDATPSISVTVAETSGQVTLYSNAACTTAASAATSVTDTSSPYEVTVDATALTADGSVTFYAKHTDAANNASDCSTASVAYTYDGTAPTVSSVGYFTTAAATTALTGPLKSGAEIYTKVTFSEDMQHVKGVGTAARPRLSYEFGTNTRFDMLNYADALGSGDCKPNHGTNTNVYVCRYTVGSSDDDDFTVFVESASVDRAGNSLAADYYASSLTLDGVAPAAPSALELASGTTSPGSDATPSIAVTVAETGGQVTLYSNAACTTAASAATDVTDTTSPIEVSVDATALTSDGAVTYYAKHADAADNGSACSSANVAYTYDGTNPGIAFPTAGPRLGSESTITLTDATAKVAKHGVIEVDGASTDASLCNTAAKVGSGNLTTVATPAASVNLAYTPPAGSLGKKACVYAEDAAGNSHARLWGTAIAAAATKPKVSLVLGKTSIDESGSGNNTTVKATLPSAASAAVTVTLGSTPTGKVSFGAATVTIPSGGTESPTTTVTAVDNDVDAPDAMVAITGTTASTAVTAPDNVSLTVTDDDTKGVTLSAANVSVNEGGQGTYTVKLDSEPTASVVVTPASGDAGAVTVSTAASDNTLTFTTSNWSTAQTVTVAGVEDADSTDESVTVTHAVSGAGSGYESVTAASVTVAVDDDETADGTAPTVLSASTGYYSDAAATMTLTGPLKAGEDIYTKVTFSEDMKHVKNDGASARPELFYRIGGTDEQYDSSSTVWIRVFFIINALGADFGRVAPHFAGCAEPGPMWLVRPPQGFPSRPPPRRRCGVS